MIIDAARSRLANASAAITSPVRAEKKIQTELGTAPNMRE